MNKIEKTCHHKVITKSSQNYLTVISQSKHCHLIDISESSHRYLISYLIVILHSDHIEKICHHIVISNYSQSHFSIISGSFYIHLKVSWYVPIICFKTTYYIHKLIYYNLTDFSHFKSFLYSFHSHLIVISHSFLSYLTYIWQGPRSMSELKFHY